MKNKTHKKNSNKHKNTKISKKEKKINKNKKPIKPKIIIGGFLDAFNFDINSNNNKKKLSKLSKLLISYEDFVPFFEENKGKIMIPPNDIGKHPVDIKVFDRISDKISMSMSKEDNFYMEMSLLFLYYLKDTIRYVNFTEYLSKVESVCENIREQIINGDKYAVIILCAEFKITKSNLWVLLLSLTFLNEHILTAIKSGKEVYICSECLNVYRELKPLKSGKKIAIIYFDDMAYSGDQINKSTPIPKNEITQFNSDSNHYYSFKDNTDIFLGIAFISENAKTLLTRNNKCIIFQNTEIVLSNENQFYKWTETVSDFDMLDDENKKIAFTIFFKRMCDNYKPDEIMLGYIHDQTQQEILTYLKEIPEEIIYPFNCNSGNILIYFDHKLADRLSTLYKFLRFGTYPITKDFHEITRLPIVCKHESIIKGCSPYEVAIDLCKPGIQKLGIQSQHACPIDFYKHIDYTLDTIKLDKSKSIIKILNNKKPTTH